MGDSIQKLISSPTPGQQTAEEALGALSLLGGSFLSNRQGRASAYGAPLQLLGGGLLGTGLYGGEKRDEQARQDALANYIEGLKPSASGAAGPDVPENKALGQLMKMGLTAPEAISTEKAVYGTNKDYEPQKFVDPQGNLKWIRPGENVPPGFVPYSETTGTSEKEKLDLYTKEKQIAQQFKTPPKALGQIQAEAEARSKGTLAALSGAPLSRFGVVGLDPKTLNVKASATMGDADSGAVLPVLKGDTKQLRQAQTAKITLDDLEATINGALPKDPGVLSASGMLGRKLTDVVNPTKLAKFNAARFGAADAFVRAITQRGNKAQFDAAMNSIVGPHATVASARAGIDQARQIIDDLTSTLTGQAGATLTGSSSSMIGSMSAPPSEEPPPPEGYE